jgi:hypothetical protein
MKQRVYHIIVLACLCMATHQVKGQVLARASVDRDKILIGEPIKLTLDVRVPLGQTVTWFNLDTIPNFEFIDKGRPETKDDIDGKQMQQVLTITSFDSGSQVIPVMTVKVGNRNYSTDTIAIEVAYTADDLSKDYRDIKEIQEVEPPGWMAYIPWIIGAVTLIAMAIIVYLLRKPRKSAAPPQPVMPALTPYQEALQALEELRKQGWGQNGEVKTYYSRLNDILRVFIFRKLNMTTMEKTNEELITQLRQLPMDRESFQQLVKALQVADSVKFARYQPNKNDNERNFAVIQTAITTLNNIA